MRIFKLNKVTAVYNFCSIKAVVNPDCAQWKKYGDQLLPLNCKLKLKLN